MTDPLSLLDTPKKALLDSKSIDLRIFLKDYERTFAFNNGRKPTKDDIKADTLVAAKYKEYNRIRDVLTGKLNYEALTAPPKSPSRKRKHERVDSGVAWSPHYQNHTATPRKDIHPSQLDPYDAPPSATPKPTFLTAIGPTPQRDGRVFGLFDMMSNSAKSSRSTYSIENRRRTVEMCLDSPEHVQKSAVAQTPSRKRARQTGDLLQHLTGTPGGTPETGNRKYSRTPISEGRKFMLSQFFATPSTVRYSNVGAELEIPGRTPLRDSVLGQSPVDRKIAQDTADTTPGYLRRTTSFKDRLLSASSPSLSDSSNLFSSFRTGPPTLRHFRSIAKPASQPMLKPQSIREEEEEESEDHGDDLDALHEIEGSEMNMLVQDDEAQAFHSRDTSDSEVEKRGTTSQPVRVWRKKGQKRTTKRARIKPAIAKLPQAPKFVAAEDADESDEFEVAEAEGAQFAADVENELLDDQQTQDAEYSEVNGDVASDYSDSAQQASRRKQKSSHAHSSAITSKDDSKRRPNSKKPGAKKAGMINPNAQSHMNFRSLKIRNKNSKASGGRGRFGRRK